MSLLTPTARSADQAADARQAAEKLEALLVQHVVTAAHLFGKSEAPGASTRADLFAEALAEAVAHGGTLGIAGASTDAAKNLPPALKGSPVRVEATHEGPRDPRHV
jgi:hypothetical protein